MPWNPTTKLSDDEKSLITGLSTRSKFYVFLRKVRTSYSTRPCSPVGNGVRDGGVDGVVVGF